MQNEEYNSSLAADQQQEDHHNEVIENIESPISPASLRRRRIEAIESRTLTLSYN